ncbi:MAG: protein phosphatase 2C domain-containing protein [Gemmatimonadaceae bacterium]
MPVATTPQTKPLVSELDVAGLTHPGKVRAKNADHFLVASFHRAMHVLASSVAGDLQPMSDDSRGVVMLVADGVGGLAHAADGSEQAIISVARYLMSMSEISLQTDPDRADLVIERLRTAMATAHQSLLDLSDSAGEVGTAATTLTIAFAVWPRMFLMHAGDSRFYRMRAGELTRLTIDQTMAQVMIDAGAMSRETAEMSRLKNVLVSAVGSPQLDPQVEMFELRRGDISFLCTDGLTRHVTDDEIADRLRGGGTSDAICRDLVDLALSRGGLDNVTVVVLKRR